MDICDITCFQQTAQHSLQTNEPHLNPIELTLCYFSSFSPGVYIDLPFLALLFLTTRRQHLASFLWPFHDVPWPPAFSSKRTAGRFFHNFMWTLLIFSLWRWHHRFICIHYHSFIFICTISLVIFAILCGRLTKNLLYTPNRWEQTSQLKAWHCSRMSTTFRSWWMISSCMASGSSFCSSSAASFAPLEPHKRRL